MEERVRRKGIWQTDDHGGLVEEGGRRKPKLGKNELRMVRRGENGQSQPEE